MARERKRRKGNTLTVNFDNVQSNVVLPETEQATLKVVSAQHKDNDGDGSLLVRIAVVKADNKKIIGKETSIWFNLGETSLWVLRNFLDALGVEIPDGPMDIDLDALVDMEFVADITQNTYNDKTSNRLANFAIADGSSDEEDEDEDEEEVVVKGKKSKAKDEDEEDEEDEEEEAPKSRKSRKSKVEEDEDEDEDEEEEEAPKSKKKSRKSRDEDDEEEEDEDEAPKKKSKKGVTYTEGEVRDMGEKELKSLVKKHDLDVDLDDYPSTRKKAMAVVDALEEAGLLESE